MHNSGSLADHQLFGLGCELEGILSANSMFLSINSSGCTYLSSPKKLLSPCARSSTRAVINPIQGAHTSSSHRLREGPSILADCSAFAIDKQCSFRNSKDRAMQMNIDQSLWTYSDRSTECRGKCHLQDTSKALHRVLPSRSGKTQVCSFLQILSSEIILAGCLICLGAKIM